MGENHHYPFFTMSNRVRPSFFMFISSAWTARQLTMPRAFHGFMLDIPSGTVQLWGPSGHVWPVKLEGFRDLGEDVLSDGWPDFCHDHRLVDGDAVVFILREDNDFDVHIFGHHGCVKRAAFAARPSADAGLLMRLLRLALASALVDK